jgi:hypothetical protein
MTSPAARNTIDAHRLSYRAASLWKTARVNVPSYQKDAQNMQRSSRAGGTAPPATR